jgi:hypothetical protein
LGISILVASNFYLFEGMGKNSQGAAIGGRKVHLQPVDTGELVEYGTGGQSWG